MIAGYYNLVHNLIAASYLTISPGTVNWLACAVTPSVNMFTTLRSALASFRFLRFQNIEQVFACTPKCFTSAKTYVEPTAAAYRAAMKQEIPIEDLPMRVNFRGKPYKPVSLQESINYLSSPGKIV